MRAGCASIQSGERLEMMGRLMISLQVLTGKLMQPPSTLENNCEVLLTK